MPSYAKLWRYHLMDASRFHDDALILEALKRGDPGARPWRDGLFPEQRLFVDDPSDRKAAVCGRRSGKTEGGAAWLLDGAWDSPNELSLYIALTSSNAWLVLWSKMHEIERRHQVGLRFSEAKGQLMLACPNGHKIWLAGCNNAADMEKFRGPRYRRVLIDEAGSYGEFLEDLVEDVLEPALVDLGGELGMMGSPPAIPAGYFYRATTGDGTDEPWPTHTWTYEQNTYLSDRARERIAKIRKRLGGDSARWRREYLGQWVRDIGALVYPFDVSRNVMRDEEGFVTSELPPGEYDYALAIDLGAGEERSTAFVLAACRRRHPEVYILKAEKRSNMTPSTIAATAERYRVEHKVRRIIIDEGGLGKGYADELRLTYGSTIEAAEKTKKRAYQELVAGQLTSGSIKLNFPACRELIDELMVLQWDEERKAEDDRFENHAADAFLYVCRALSPWYRPEVEPPREGTEAAMRAEMKKRKDAAMKKAREQGRGKAKRWG